MGLKRRYALRGSFVSDTAVRIDAHKNILTSRGYLIRRFKMVLPGDNLELKIDELRVAGI